MSTKTFHICGDDVSDGYHTFGELYEHRHALFLALMTVMPERAWYSRLHHDGTMIGDDWFIAGIRLPGAEGDITYHMPMMVWRFVRKTGAMEMDRAPEWDGHTSLHVRGRLLEFVERGL